MPKQTRVFLPFMPVRLAKLLDFGKENMWRTSRNTYKYATIAMNIVSFILDLRHDPVFNMIINKEGILPLSLILRELNRYAVKKGYGIIQLKNKP